MFRITDCRTSDGLPVLESLSPCYFCSADIFNTLADIYINLLTYIVAMLDETELFKRLARSFVVVWLTTGEMVETLLTQWVKPLTIVISSKSEYACGGGGGVTIRSG